MKSIFNKVITSLLTCISLILFCPLTFAHGFEQASRSAEETGETADLIGMIFGFGFVLIYMIFAVWILVLFFKKWNKTNKALENINKSLEKINEK